MKLYRNYSSNGRIWTALAALAALSACGGSGGSAGGGAISTPSPVPTPTPTPAPTPTPTPTPPPTNFNTNEFQRSDGPGFHNAITAWQAGITGTGKTIAVIDTGIDTDSPEFAGRIHPDSADVAGNGTVEAFDDHGTNVAMVAAAARDNTGIMGIAFNATILALRADEPGSCSAEGDASLDGCLFNDRDIATGVDRAVASGATVINLSLGGGSPTRTLRNAITRAANAGVVIIVSAGNDGQSTEADIDPDQPDPFATGLLAAGGSNVIIVGSVDDDGAFSSFSNRAGNSAASFLTARGRRICCIYENGSLRVTTNASGQRVSTLFSGTSFSAPQVAGAVALLAQAFPNLTGAQIVEILLNSANDAGAAGSDAIFGRGILDIAAAIAPAGRTTLAGTTSTVRYNNDSGVASTPMGGALANAKLGTVITDKYDRAYNYDLGSRFRAAAVQSKLQGVIEDGARNVASGNRALSLSFTIADTGDVAPISQLRLTQDQADQARVLAAQIAFKLAPDTDFAFGFSQSANGLVGQLQGQSRPAFLIAGSAVGETGFNRSSDASVAIRRQIGPWGITASADTGDVHFGNFRLAEGYSGRERERRDVSSIGVSADRKFGAVETALGVTHMQEEDTILGAYFDEAFGAGGANTMFVDASAAATFARNWRVGAAFRQGYTRASRLGLIASGSDFGSQAWSIDVSRHNMFSAGDSVGFRLSQPLRVSGGGLNLNLPVAYDYTTQSAQSGIRRLSLSPDGREIMGEFAWRGWLLDGSASASVFYRRQPGHLTNIGDDAGIAVKWNRSF